MSDEKKEPTIGEIALEIYQLHVRYGDLIKKIPRGNHGLLDELLTVHQALMLKSMTLSRAVLDATKIRNAKVIAIDAELLDALKTIQSGSGQVVDLEKLIARAEAEKV